MGTKETQTARILHLLKNKKVVTNTELNRICFRYGARIFELRREGYIIKSNHVKDGQWEFSYHGHIDDKVKEYAD